MTGLARRPKAASRVIAAEPSFANVGSALNVPSISLLRRASVAMTVFQFLIEP